eukprot:symbB.v1.2.012985.t1/scaffold909.1/size153080/4
MLGLQEDAGLWNPVLKALGSVHWQRVQVLLEGMSHHGPTPNNVTENTVAHVYVEHWRQALAFASASAKSSRLDAMLEKLKVSDDKHAWLMAIALIADGKANDLGFRLSCSGCTNAMVTCSMASQWQMSLHLFDWQRSTGPLDVGCVTAAIRACEKGLQGDQALALLQKAQWQGLESNLQTAFALLECMAASRQWWHSLVSFEEFDQEFDQLNARCLNSVMRALHEGQQWRRSLTVLEEKSSSHLDLHHQKVVGWSGFLQNLEAFPTIESSPLSNDPAVWGFENPVGLVALPCRKRRSVFNFENCCGKSRPKDFLSFPDHQLEEHFAECFQRGTAGSIRYALEHCCDERASILTSNKIFRSYFTLAQCLSNCTQPQVLVDPDCGCEMRFLQRILRDSGLPKKRRRFFASFALRIRPFMTSLYGHKPKDQQAENLRYALRMLEHLIISPQLGQEPQKGEAWRMLAFRYPDAHELHTTLTSQLRRARGTKLPPPPKRGTTTGPALHVAMIASVGAPPYGRQALATVRSALYFTRQKLHFHLFVDSAGKVDMEKAMRENLEPSLWRRVEQVDFYMQETMKEVWPFVKRYVPLSCMAQSKEYGSPGWMRLFPERIRWKAAIEHLIWVDAGDFLFFADPALLLREHLKKLKGQVVATYPEKQPWALQIFALQRMRDRQWTTTVGRLIGVEWQTNRTGNHYHLCFMAEGMFMMLMSQNYPRLFRPVAPEWAHEPRLPFFNGVLQQPERLGGYRDAPQIYKDREHPGLIDWKRGFVFCPSFADFFAHAVATMNYPFFVVEVAQAIERTQLETRYMLTSGFYEESPVYGNQMLRCGQPILGLHMIRQFHQYMPWGLRLLDFWSNVTGLWGKRPKGPGVIERNLPARLDEVT